MLNPSRLLSRVFLGVVICFAGCGKPGENAREDASNAAILALKPQVAAAALSVVGKTKSGSGFLCDVGGKPYVLTSESVLSEEQGFTIEGADGTVLKPKRLFSSANTETVLVELMEQPRGVDPMQAQRLPDPGVKPGDTAVLVGMRSRGLIRAGVQMGVVSGEEIVLENMPADVAPGSAVVHPSIGKALGVVLKREVLPELTSNFRQDIQALASRTQPDLYVQRLDRLQKWEPLDWTVYQQNETALKQSMSELNSVLIYLSGRGYGARDFLELSTAHKRCATALATPNLSLNDRTEAKNRLLRDLDSFLRRAENRMTGARLTWAQRSRGARLVKLAAVGRSQLQRIQGDVSIAELFFKDKR
jgi:hypothetical protein